MMEADPTLVNGSGKHDDIPHTQEPQVKQPVEPVNGLDHNDLEEPDVDNIPINGDVNAQDDLIGNEVMDQEGGADGDIILPPPPEDMSGFPPPLGQQDVDTVEPESNIEPESHVGKVGNEIFEEDVMGESVEGVPQVENIGVKQVVEDVSEEELVSDEGVHDEVELEQPEPPAQQQQLIDFGGEQEVPGDMQVTGDNILDSPVPDESESGLEHELVPEPVMVAPEPEMVVPEPVTESEPHAPFEPEPVLEPLAPFEPEPVPEPLSPTEQEPVPEPLAPAEQEPVHEEPELQPEIETVQQPVAVQEPEPVCEDTSIVPDTEPEPLEEPVIEVAPPAPTGEISQVTDEPGVKNFKQEEETTRDIENDYIQSELVVEQPPDIIAQTTEEPHEVQEEAPPPPPPPLVDETPPPPPPLDDSIQLKRDSRRSGEVTPKKESPVEPPAVHVHEPTPIAVVAPVMKAEEKVEKPEPQQPAPEPEVVAPVVSVEENDKEGTEDGQGSVPVSPVSSPARSEGAGSEGALSEPQELASPQVSQKINKKNFKNKIKFHVDLVEASLKQLNFLSSVNKQTSLQEEWLFKQAIRRYEAFWLPLAAEHKKEHLAAPLDIEWVWHCHMLAPAFYETDCVSVVGKVVDHKLYSEKERTKALEKSRKYWTAKYPNEPFEIELVYKEKSEEAEPVAETSIAQESDGKGENIPYVEEGTSESEPKGKNILLFIAPDKRAIHIIFFLFSP